MTNKLKALLLLPILSILLTACTLQDLPVIGSYFPGGEGGGSGGIDTGPTSINIWGLWENSQVMDSVILQYQNENPNATVTYEDRSVMNVVDYKERVFSRVQQESSDIDIFLVHNSWVPRIASSLSPAPESVITAEEYNNMFYPAASKTGVLNGQVYAIPAFYDGLVLVYNKAHFNEIGQTLPPTAWEEFRRLALELTVRGGEEGTDLIRGGAAIGTANNVDHYGDILGLMWSQAGVSIPSQLDSASSYDALTYYTNFTKEDRVWDDSMPEATAAFVQERTSMILVPSWQILTILELMPDIEDVGVAEVPQAVPANPATWGTFWTFVVPNNAPNNQAAWNFLNYFKQESTQLSYFSEASKVRAFGAPFALTSLAAESSNQYIRPVLDSAPYSNSAEIGGRAGNRRQTEALKKAINQVLYEGVSAENALNEAKEEIDR